MIRSVKLVNFVSHKDTSIELPHGLTAIIGRNGAGKTSILDAISYASFKQHSRGRDENLINRRASSARVQLQFSSNGRSYEITWRIERGKRARATLKDSETGSLILIDAGERTVIPEMEKILGVSRDVFLNAAYIKQGEIARLLEARPAERKELISKLLGIDALEKIWESLRTPIKVLEEKLERLREEAGRRLELEEKLREVSSSLSESEKLRGERKLRLEKLEEKLKEIEDELRRLDEERSRAEGLKEAISKLERLIDGRREGLNSARRELELVEEAEKRVSGLKEVVEEKKRLESEVEEIRRKISELKSVKGRKEMLKSRVEEISEEISSLRSFIKESLETLEGCLQLEKVSEEEFSEKLSAAIEENRRIREELRDRIRRLDEELGGLRGRRRTLLGHLEELEAGGSLCPLCRRPMSSEHRERVRESIRRELAEVEERISVFEVERDELELDSQRVSSTLDRLSKLDPERFQESLSKVKSLEHELAELEKELKEVREESLDEAEEELEDKLSRLKEVERKIIEFERERGLIEKLGSVEAVRRKISRLASEISELENKKRWMEERLSKLEYDPEAYRKLREEENKILREVSDLKADVSALSQKIEDLRSELKSVRDELAKVESAERAFKALESYIRSLKAVRECFGKNGVQRYARALAKRSIEYYSKRFLQFFSLIYSDLKLDEDYNVYLYGPFGEQSIDSLSGGEKTAVALCLRLGIAAALIGDQIGCILMDEPTTHLDPERRRELIRLLTNFRSERGLIPQVIIVTHDPEVEQAADQVYRVTLRGGYSHVEKI